MASPKQTLHPIFLKKWMGKIEDPRKLNFFTPPTALLARKPCNCSASGLPACFRSRHSDGKRLSAASLTMAIEAEASRATLGEDRPVRAGQSFGKYAFSLLPKS